MKSIGLDIGGSRIRAVLLDGERVLRRKQIETPENLVEFKKAVLELIAEMSRLARDKLFLGIGVAGAVLGTKVVFAPNIRYLKNFDFKNISTSDVHRLDNDARCFARAEIGSANGRFLKNHSVLFITLGTGIGRALAKNGRVKMIKKFEYPERWEGEYQKLRDRSDDKILTEFLAKRFAPMIKTLKSKTIVTGGGVLARKLFLGKLKKAFLAEGLKIKIVRAKLGGWAGAIGAALSAAKIHA